MPNQDFKISFSIDLTPFAAGLKSMLIMTADAGQQMQPLLNMQMKAPNFAGIEAELDTYKARLEGLAQVEQQAAAGGQPLPGVIDDVGKKAVTSAGGVNAHSESLRGMRREFSHMFGAIGFVVMSLESLGGFMSSTDKDTQKFTQSLLKGVQSGFGLAMMLQMIPSVSMGAALGVGSLVAVGLSLLSFFDKSEEKAASAKKALESFASGLKGATAEDLQAVRDRLNASIADQQKLVGTLNDLKAEAASRGNLSMAVGYWSDAKEQQEALDKMVAQREEIQKRLDALLMTDVDAHKQADKLELDSMQDKFGRERKEANDSYNDILNQAKAGYNAGKLSEDAYDALIEVAHAAHAVKMKQIDFDEATAHDAQQKMIRDIEISTTKDTLDQMEKQDLARATSEKQRVDITERYALARLSIEEDAAIESLEIEKKRLEALGGADNLAKVKQIAEQEAAIREQYSTKAGGAKAEAQIKVEEAPVGSILAQQQVMKDATEAFNKATTDSARRAAKEQLDVEKKKYEEMVAAYPLGSILAQQLKVKEAQEKLDNAVGITAQENARKEVKAEQDKLEKMKMSNEEYLRWRTQKQQEEWKMWEDTHKTSMVAINSTTEGFKTMWSQFAMDNRQAKDGWDAAWLSMKNAAIQALGDLLVNEVKNFLISAAMHKSAEVQKVADTSASAAAQTGIVAGSMAAETAMAVASMAAMSGGVVAAMAPIIAAAGPAATLVSIATFGGAAATGEAAILAALGATKAASMAVALEKGGKISKGTRGFFEGEQDEIVAPEKTFVDVARDDLIPKVLSTSLPRIPDLSGMTAKAVQGAADRVRESQASQPAGGGLSTKVLEREMIAMRKAVEGLGDVVFIQRGKDLYGTWKLADKNNTRLKS